MPHGCAQPKPCDSAGQLPGEPAATFANRILSTALGEGRCVFIGLSMTDINILRWLALRIAMFDLDFEVREPPELVAELRTLARRLGRAAR